jgi:muramoyltetrapeptide carboxypeptidase LdcA involved in peptidoglycan recycling
MRPELIVPGKAAPGDRVAVVSPGFAAPGRYPEVHELGMRRLREEIGLEPVEYPTTRELGASPQARAADLMAAFADPGAMIVFNVDIGHTDPQWVIPSAA